MPNHCSNKVKFTFDSKKAMNALVNHINHPPENADQSGFCYLSSWGTKWGDYETVVSLYSEEAPWEVELVFDSAWSPPIELYEWIDENIISVTRIEAVYNEAGIYTTETGDISKE